MTGQPLRFGVVSGGGRGEGPADAGRGTRSWTASKSTGPVRYPKGGQALLILKTAKDAKSYYREGDAIVFNRPLSIPRNSVVLPAGYELVACNVPSQVLTEPDGRVAISFMNGSGAQAPLVVKAELGAQIGAAPRAPGSAKSWESPFEGETELERLSERAHQDREIVYLLEQPETHAFHLYHDYTESRPGVDKYFNVVRSGSKVSDPSAYVLDTGEKLATKITTGAELAAAKVKVDAGEPVEAAAQVVVISFSPVKAGQNVRLRISETYAAPASYRLEGDELVFDRSLGRPRNAVVLPNRMVPDGQLNSGNGHTDGGWPHPTGLLEWSAGPGGCADQGEAPAKAR